MERETRLFETKNGHKAVLKTYVTGGEFRAISDVYLNAMNMKVGSDGTPDMHVNAGVIKDMQDKAIETIVVSLDGSEENVLSRVLELPKNEFDEIAKAVDEVKDGLDDKKKEI